MMSRAEELAVAWQMHGIVWHGMARHGVVGVCLCILGQSESGLLGRAKAGAKGPRPGEKTIKTTPKTTQEISKSFDVSALE